jgi:aminoglycoside phosphotransferase (APT) family kinase protein
MHPGEVELDDTVVRRLVDTQFPRWASLPLERIDSSGTVNVLYRLGPDLVLRLPRVHGVGEWAAGAFERDVEWLPRLAEVLPVAVPRPVAKGSPGDGYPSDWSVYAWLPGEHPDVQRLGDPEGLARQLAAMIQALRGFDPAGAPASKRAFPLEHYDEATRAALELLEAELDSAAVLDAWERALGAPVPQEPPVWAHGDLMPANLLLDDRGLSAVLDWEAAGLADPAVDLQPAWNLLPAAGRNVFREELQVDDDTWERGRGWALWTGIVALPYYRETNPELAGNAAFRIGQILDAE